MVVADEVDREDAAFHEAGHAVITMRLGGTINDEGVEIDERQYCGVRLYGQRESAWREFAQVLVDMAGWHAEHLHHGCGASRSDRDSAELDQVISKVREEAFRHPDDEIEDDDRFDAIGEMLRHNPDATDEGLCERYEHFTALCCALLRDSTIQTAIAAVASALLRTGRLDYKDVLEAIGGSADSLQEAALRVVNEVGIPRD